MNYHLLVYSQWKRHNDEEEEESNNAYDDMVMVRVAVVVMVAAITGEQKTYTNSLLFWIYRMEDFPYLFLRLNSLENQTQDKRIFPRLF